MNGLELKRITDAPHKALGERALALGMPFEDIDGLADGAHEDSMADHCRVGCFRVTGYSDEYCDFAAGDLHKTGKASWPDFRCAVTEAWLVAWGLTMLPGAFEERMLGADGVSWLVWHDDGDEYRSVIRAEAWILAIEKMKGEE